MADEVPSQARFIGGLSLVLMIVVVAFALLVVIAGNMAPPL